MMYRQRMQSLMSTQALAHVMHIPHLVHRAHSQWITHLHTSSRYMRICRVYICTPGHLHRPCIYTVTMHTQYVHIHYIHSFVCVHIHPCTYKSAYKTTYTAAHSGSLAQDRVCCVSLQWRRVCPVPLPFPERLDVWKVLFSIGNQHSAGLWRSRAE